MKKLMILSAVALVALSCAKKEENTLVDSNVMLQEPEVKIVDTTSAATAPAVSGTAVAPTDSAAVKTDSVK